MSFGLKGAIRLLSRAPTCILKAKRLEHLLDPLIWCEAEVPFRQDRVVVVDGHHVDLEVEPGGPDEGRESLQRRGDLAGLDPCHGWLGDAGAGGELLLRHGGSPAGLPEKLTTPHAASIQGVHSLDARSVCPRYRIRMSKRSDAARSGVHYADSRPQSGRRWERALK